MQREGRSDDVSHAPFAAKVFGEETWEAFLDDQPAAPGWDEFLEASPLGQFQQSGRWAAYKAIEGWRTLRIRVMCRGCIMGGVQVLFRQSKAGKIGYVSKGPVLADGSDEAAPWLWDLLCKTLKKFRIRMAIIQPPDKDRRFAEVMGRAGLLANHLIRVIEATLLVDLTRGMEAVEKAFTKETAKKVRQAQASGLLIREGEAGDLKRFFELMLMSCVRQNETHPNPSSLEALEALWKSFAPGRRIQLLVAEFDGEAIAGFLNFRFGDTLTLWKKGWNSKNDECRPNDILVYESFRRACAEGMKWADFGGASVAFAKAVLSGAPLLDNELKSRHFFQLRFGSQPALLPPALVYIPNPALRTVYRAAFGTPIGERLVSRLLRRF